MRRDGRDHWHRVAPAGLREAAGRVRDLEDFWAGRVAQLERRPGRAGAGFEAGTGVLK